MIYMGSLQFSSVKVGSNDITAVYQGQTQINLSGTPTITDPIDPGGSIDWGDGSPLENIINSNMVHTYDSPGTYTVTVYSDGGITQYLDAQTDIIIPETEGEGSAFTTNNGLLVITGENYPLGTYNGIVSTDDSTLLVH